MYVPLYIALHIFFILSCCCVFPFYIHVRLLHVGKRVSQSINQFVEADIPRHHSVARCHSAKLACLRETEASAVHQSQQPQQQQQQQQRTHEVTCKLRVT